jgi:hypothetical protein
VARNRYGWEKRAKEIARKQKSDEKMKKRQKQATAEEIPEEPKAQEEGTIEELPGTIEE